MAKAKADVAAGRVQFSEEDKKRITRWNNFGQASVLLFALAAFSPLVVQRVASNPRASLLAGIVVIVAIGATGQVLRGLGETFPKYGSTLKAYGYYFGASAYVATASVALVNGLPKLLGL